MSAASAIAQRGRRLRRPAIVALVSLSALAAEPPAGPPPAEFIAAAAETLAAAVVAERAQLEGDRARRQALIDELLLPKFDLDAACRLILGEHWRTAGEAEQRRFVEAFYRYLVASHGAHLPRFRRETLTVLPGQDVPIGASTRVRTQLRLTDGDRFDVDFYLRQDERGWRIVDVIVEGISYIRTYRSDFGAEIRSRGLEELVLRLEGIANE